MTALKKKITINNTVKNKIKLSLEYVSNTSKSNNKNSDLLFCKFKICETYGAINPRPSISARLDTNIRKTKKNK